MAARRTRHLPPGTPVQVLSTGHFGVIEGRTTGGEYRVRVFHPRWLSSRLRYLHRDDLRRLRCG